MKPFRQTPLPALTLVLFGISIGCNWDPLHRVDQRRVALATSQARAFAEGLEAFKRDTGTYPDTLDELVSNSHQRVTWRGPYLKYLPFDPWDNPYNYMAKNDGSLLICSFGSDGRRGGAGLAADIVVIIRQNGAAYSRDGSLSAIAFGID